MKDLLFFTAEKLPFIQITDLFLGVRCNVSEVVLIFNTIYTIDLEAPCLRVITPAFKDQIKNSNLIC